MSSISLKNTSGNAITLQSSTSLASDVTLTLPVNDGDASQFLQTDGAGVLSWQTVSDTGTTWTTSQETASGSSGLLLSSIPSTAEQIIIAYTNLSISTTGSVRIRIGDSGGLETTNSYNMFRGFFGSSTGGGAATTSFWGQENFTGSANVYNGTVFITRNTTNGWSVMWNQSEVTSNTMGVCTGEKSLSDVLTQVQLFPSAGTFDSGSVRFKYLS
jgi:hypothetical protein